MVAKKKVEAPAKPKIALPAGVVVDDLKYPQTPESFFDDKAKVNKRTKDKWYADNKIVHRLHMVYVMSYGWCIRTLHISNGKMSERSYAIRVDDQTMCTLGNGPHVQKEITVYVTQARIKELRPLVDIMQKGEEGAHIIRDRRSSRRAQTQLRRASRGMF
jgi:hypothetical protein